MPVDFTKEKEERRKNGVECGVKTIVVHIHGGGFIGLSSRTHQNYLRKWAKLIPNSMIMSIDYRLAPDFVYPDPLDDVWQGYYWILTQCETQIGIYAPLTVIGVKPQIIVVSGDSAGGNLSMGLSLRALHTGIRMPDGIVLGYPGILTKF